MLKYILLLAFVSGDLTAKTLFVSKEKSNLPLHFLSVQDAVNYSKSGDKIVVKPGIYRESVIINKSRLEIVSEVKHAAIIDGSEVIEKLNKCTLDSCGINDPRLVYFDLDWEPSIISQSDNAYNLCSSSDQVAPYKVDVSKYSHFDQVDFDTIVPKNIVGTQLHSFPMLGIFFDKGKYVKFIESSVYGSIHEYLNGSGFLSYDNRFSVYNNLKFLDKEGEYCLLKRKNSHLVRVVLYPIDESPVSVSHRPYGFYFKGEVNNVSVSGFVVRNINGYSGFSRKWDAGRGFFVASSKGGNNVTINGNKIYHNEEGIEFRFRSGDRLENNQIYNNLGNGVHLISGENYHIIDNEIHNNLKDGVFVGSKPKSGNKDSVVNIHIAGNHIYGHDSRFTHADSLQLYKVTNAYIYSNIIGDSTQPVWFQSLNNIILFNNIFYGGVNKVRFNSHSDTENVCAINNAFLNGVSVEKNISGFWLYNNIVTERSVYHCSNCQNELEVKNIIYILGDNGFQVYDYNGQHVFKNARQNVDGALGSGNSIVKNLEVHDYGPAFFYENNMSFFQVNPYYLNGESADNFCGSYLYNVRR